MKDVFFIGSVHTGRIDRSIERCGTRRLRSVAVVELPLNLSLVNYLLLYGLV